MKKLCSIVTALIMAVTIFIVPNFGLAYASEPESVNDDQAVTEDISATEEQTEEPEATENTDATVAEPAAEPELKVAALEAPSLTVDSSSDAITFSWDAVEGAEGYKVSEDNGKTWIDCEETSYSLQGNDVTLSVKAFAGDTESDVVAKTLTAPRITLTKVSTYANPKTALASIRYDWPAASEATGYAYRRSAKDAADDHNYRDNGDNAFYIYTGLKQRTKYRIFIRAYVEVPVGTEGGVWINPPAPSTQEGDYKYVLLGPATTTKNPTLTPSVEKCVATKYSKGYKYVYYDQHGVYRGDSYAMWNTIKNKSSKTKYLIALDTRRNNVVVYKGKKGAWKPIKHFVCATGMPGHRTPRGDFKIKSKKPKFQTGDKVGKTVVKAKYTCWYATRIKGAIFFHSTLYHLNSKSRHAARHVGKHYSHGCIRLELANARWIYQNCGKGTAVISRKYGADCSYGFVYSYKY